MKAVEIIMPSFFSCEMPPKFTFFCSSSRTKAARSLFELLVTNITRLFSRSSRLIVSTDVAVSSAAMFQMTPSQSKMYVSYERNWCASSSRCAAVR